MDHTTYRRSELYTQIWAEPMTKVAARLGVSDVALAKVCRKLGVPSPPRGYWAKKSAGQTPKRPSLPPLREGEQAEVTIRREHVKQAGAGVVPKGPDPEVIVQPTLDRPHDLVAATARDLRTAKSFHDGMVSGRRGDGRLNIHVAPASIDRAMRIADALLKACKRHGIAVEIDSLQREGGWRYRSVNRELENQTCLRIHGETLTLSIREHWSIYRPPVPAHLKRASRAKELRHWQFWEGRSRRVPNGVLELQLNGEYAGRMWKDTKRQLLESSLGDIIGRMPALAADNKTRRAEEEERRRAETEAERRRWNAEERARKEREREAAFRKQVKRWKLARNIRAYVAEACATGRFGQKDLDWALAYAARIDPIGSPT